MKLAKIVMPLLDNAGRDLFHEHQHLQHALLTKFGGFTKTHGAGQWLSPHKKIVVDEVAIYEIAMERADVTQLRCLVQDYAHMCRQEHVMMVTPCGDVEFVKPLTTREMLQKSLEGLGS